MSVHYKFKSALEYDTVTFDGLHISVKDLKKAIIHQKRIGKNTDFDLQVTNAQTKEVYNDENALIPKNTSLVIARVPLASQTKSKPWEGYGAPQGAPQRPEEGALSKAVDLTQLDASEDDKIKAMMSQSTLDYDPSNYRKLPGSNQVGVVPTHYRCFKCHQPGHWIKDCPLGHGQEPMEIKKSTGIPRSFMVPVEGPMVPGAMMTPTGQYAVPVLDHQAYNEGPKIVAPPQDTKPEIPEDLICTICKDLLTDAVMIPCCGNSFCDECIRTILLESEEHECPDCREKEISPGTLIPNRFLRNSVANFKNETGYHKRLLYRNAVGKDNEGKQDPILTPAESTTSPPSPPATPHPPPERSDSQKPIISEADSTESAKSKEEIIASPVGFAPEVEHPPGVESPEEKGTVQGQAIMSVGGGINHHRVNFGQNPPTRVHERERHYQIVEERPGTPTVDEPGIAPPGYSYTDLPAPSATVLPPLQHLHPPPSLQTPYIIPPTHQPPPGVYPAASAPPPGGFRLPPPGHADYNRVPQNINFVGSLDPTIPPPNVAPPPQGFRPVFYTPPPGYPPFRPRYPQPPPPGLRQAPPHAPPPSVLAPPILDPLEAFQRMLAEKDARSNRRWRRSASRSASSTSGSYSRSRSRSPKGRSPRRGRSLSRARRSPRRSPRARSRTRSPRRSRSRSFTMSRSYSRSPSFRGSVSPRRRYRSPVNRNSPPRYRYKDRHPAPPARAPFFEPEPYDTYDYERSRARPPLLRNPPRGPPRKEYGEYFPPEGYANRYQRGPTNYPPPLMSVKTAPPERKFEDLAPPGTDQPPVPGFEPIEPQKTEKTRKSPLLEEKFEKPAKKEDSGKNKKEDEEEKQKKSKDKKRKKEKREAEKKRKEEKKSKRKQEKLKKAEEKKLKQTEIEEKTVENVEKIAETPPKKVLENKIELYEDMQEGIDTTVVENYGKKLNSPSPNKENNGEAPAKTVENVENEIIFDGIELQANEAELETKPKPEMLAPLPELSKWELEEEVSPTSENKNELKQIFDRPGKVVTSEVIKRAENAIFAKAINAIRPIEIKKISLDRAKLYSGEKPPENPEKPVKNLQITIPGWNLEEIPPPGTQPIRLKKTTPPEAQPIKTPPPSRISIKERLGCKVEELKLSKESERNRSRTLSPLSRRIEEGGRNVSLGERKVELEAKQRENYRKIDNRRPFDRYRLERSNRAKKDYKTSRNDYKTSRKDYRRSRSRFRERKPENNLQKERKSRRSRTRSSDREKRHKSAKKHDKKKEKPPKKENHKPDITLESKIIEKSKPKLVEDRRKPTLDEANFSPDYEDTESEKDDKPRKREHTKSPDKKIPEKKRKIDEKQQHSTSETSDTSSDEKHKKKHKKHKKKKSRKDSSSSSDSSDSDSSVDKKKKKKSSKKLKKKKKSKHK